ncbi:hypothetical protein [Oceaniglobus ichthyenteri]|uniref:hypothetical protein n=1 Tax=Oceaniglobus ichthyenteri TaxID=2136177 RepID=UPI000D372756|nr:hypothetical protein [Oceaniglobus ichthyenteri]
MPLDRLVLILACVVIGAGVTVWLITFFAAAATLPFPAMVLLVPVGLFAWVVWRVIAERLNNREDDHYDRIEK